MEKRLTVDVLIVNYNTRDLTIDCLASLQSTQLDSINMDVVLVDNASTDGSVEAISKRFPEVSVIASQQNLGFGRANNVASRSCNGDYILLLNSDTLVRPDSIPKLLKFAQENPQAGIWGGKTLFGDGSLNATCCWRFMNLWSLVCFTAGLTVLFPRSSLFNWEAYGGWQRDNVRSVDIVVGAFLLIERKLWDQLGGFDETFFMYAEEADLCFRAKQSGASPLFSPSSEIVHFGGLSEPKRGDKIYKLWKGKCTFIRKNWNSLAAGIGIGLLQVHVLSRYLAYATRAALSRNSRHRETSQQWQHVWNLRSDWTRGYALT